MNGQIVCRLKGGAKLSFNVPHGEAVVGREPGLAVAVPADGVSRRHAKISWDGGSYWIEDLKSTNGTFVNGTDVAREGKERLRHLDVISLGRGIDLLFLVRDAPAATITRQGVLRAALIPEEGEGAPYEIGIGEVTMGRSAANNVVFDSSAVSKLHARIQRTTDHVVLQDLNSSNGTFVNSARVMTALLQDGDKVSLAGVVSYRVMVEMGEVNSLPDVRPAVRKSSEDQPEFEADWKTRYEWDSGEYAELMALRQGIAESEAQGRSKKDTGPTRPAAARPAERVESTSKLAAVKAPPRSAPPAAPAKPVTPSQVPGPKPTAWSPTPAKAAPASPPPAAAPAPAPAKPAAPPAPAAPAPPPAARSIARVRLVGPGVDLSVTAPGSYDIGRLSDVPLRIVHPTVSRRQARLILSSDRTSVRLEHIGSSPTLVNDRVLNDATSLADGDQVRFGEVTLAVKLE